MTTSKIQSVSLLPIYFQTDKNSKFLSSTIDQLIQPPQLERVSAFIGYKPPTVSVTTSNVTSATVTTYTAIDSATLEKSGIYYSTTQIGPRREGTKITIDISVADDSFSGPYNLGFTWNMFGQLFTQVYISTNGVLTFGSGSRVYSPIEFGVLPQPTIYSMYTDLFEGFGGLDGTTPLDSGEIPGHYVKQGTIGSFKFFRMRFQGTHFITGGQTPTVPSYDYETTLYSDGTSQYIEHIYQNIPRTIRGLGQNDLGVVVGIATSSTGAVFSTSTNLTTSTRIVSVISHGMGIQLNQDLINDNSSHVFYSTQNGGNWHYAGPGSFDVTKSDYTTVISSTTYITSSSIVFTTITTTTTYVDFSKLPTWNPADSYIQESSSLRQTYQLEPALITYNIADEVQSVVTIDDLSNEIKIKGGYSNNFDRLFRSTVYPFYPQIDLDKFYNYQNYYWLQSGSFLIDIDQPNLDIETSIIGKSSATVMVNGAAVTLLNGMLVTFSGVGIDSKYQYREFFTEGVGTSIVLVPLNDLITPESIAAHTTDFYDFWGYDSLGFDSTDSRAPFTPEYITINRASVDRNPWSRYNRWVSLEVITISSKLNNLEIITPISNRANRPIIEFNANIKLYNFGSTSIPPVDVIDFSNTDAFNSIDGIEGTVITSSTKSTSSIIIDGVNLSYGTRIIFAADKNPLIRNKVFTVFFSYLGGSPTPVITLIPDSNGALLLGSSVLVKKGKLYGGTSWWFDGVNWNYSQQHTKINEAPLFDLFDANGISYSDQTHYFSNFVGNKIFGYSINDVSTDITDTVLNLSLNYLNNNVKASILFENYFSKSSINLIGNGETVTKISTGQTYIKINNDLVNVWQQPLSLPINLNTSTGYYDTPLSLTNNPLNDQLDMLVLGDIQEQNTKTGTRLIATENPISFAMMFVGKKEHSVVDAISKCSDQYEYFKLSLINNLSKVTIALGAAEALDKILENINANKTIISPFYLSDMVGHGQNKQVIQYTVNNSQTSIYGLPIEFSLTSPSNSSILIYLNGSQLTFGNDYTFNINDPYVSILTSLTIGDQITINYYQDTRKNYIPPTPTKLGLYPKFLPKIYLDDTYVTPTNVIQGHDGSLMVAFNDYRDSIILEYELRVFNNLKVTYNQNLFDIHSVDPGYWRDLKNVSDYTFSEITSILEKDFIKWAINYGIDYTTNNTFNLTNPFTWNYPEKGSWRAIFKYYYDTDRPHTHPWEMLGLDQKPNWWDSHYGMEPYTSGNSILWKDLETGTISGTPNGPTINNFYARPGLSNKIPVNDSGKLLDPVEIGLTSNPTPIYGNYSWAVGEQGPAETAWRRSSSWPFTIQRLLSLTKTASYSSLMYDPANMAMNSFNQWEYSGKTGRSFLQLQNIPIHGENDVSVDSGYSVFVSEIGQQRDKNYISMLRSDLNYVDFNLFYKVGGFLNKDTIQFFIDAYEPTTNSSGVLLPDSDYSLILNTSNPIDSVGISGIIIQRVGNNFVVIGYDRDEPYFNYTPAIRNSSTPSITVGGVSSDYVNWTSGNSGSVSSLQSLDLTTAAAAPSKIFYQKDQIVQYGGTYYRTIASHQAESTFNLALFSKLPGLPVIGGVTVQTALEFETRPIKIPYGTTFTSIQGVYDLIIGYGNWLTNLGFSFNQFNSDLGQVVDWKLSAKEFLYWTTQNWVNNSVITLSPFADQLVFQLTDASVNNIFDSFYNYSLTKSDGTPFDKKNLFITRQNGVFNVNTINTNDGIYFARLNAVQKEHGVIFKNKTIFGDIVYDPKTGDRQSRIKIVGFRTANWNGDFFSPGFVYDSAAVTDWKPNTKYLASSIVRYNNFYYSAISNIDRSPTFVFSNWTKLTKKPNAGLLPNFDYKINQFNDFYSLDIDNFDTGQQRAAQNLIGYYPRVYLNNIIPDPVSQYKFYQGYIQEKGTANAIAKLSKAQTANLNTDIEVYENWAIRVGQYGGFTSSQEFEIPLIEGTFVENPQIITFVPPLITTNYSPAHYINPFDFTITPSVGATPKINTTTSTNVFNLTHAGYVRLDDVDATAYNQTSLLDIANSSNLLEGTTIWLGFKPNGDWDVLRYKLLGADIVDAEFDTIYSNVTITTSKNHNLSVGQIISIVNINKFLDGVYAVQLIVSPTKFIITNNTAYATSSNFSFPGFLFAFESMRFLNFDSIPSDEILYQYDTGSYLWIDSENGTDNNGWAVYKKVQNYSNAALIGRHSSLSEGHGYSISLRKGSDILVVGAPLYIDSINGNSGALFVYRNSTLEELSFYPMPNTSGNNNKLGATVIYDDKSFQNIPNSFGLIFAGAPGAYNNSGTVQIISIDQTYQPIIQGTLTNPSQSPTGLFGSSIFVQRDSNTKTVLVGAPGVNSVYSYIITATNSMIQISEATTVLSSVSLVANAQWGYAIVGSDRGNCIAISAPFNGDTNSGTVTIIYSSTNAQTILSPFGNDGNFGQAMAMSPDGTYLAISAPNAVNTNLSYGAVAIYNKPSVSATYTLTQILTNLIPNGKMYFGMALDINTSSNSLVVTAMGTNTTVLTIFDNFTTFDFDSTRFYESEDYSGTAYLYTRKNVNFKFSQEVNELIESVSSLTNYGASVAIDDNLIIVGAPSTVNQSTGTVYKFSKIDNTINGWQTIRIQEDLLIPSALKQIRLIDTTSDEIVSYYDFVDPLKGKILGIADEELTYKTSSDPAIYTLGSIGVNVDSNNSWIDQQVGQLWWDLSTAKFVWYEQGGFEYRKNNWGKLFPGASIDVYEWVGSTLLPSEWSALADTISGLSQGISGQPKYVDNSTISVKQVYDTVTQSFSNFYFYWVKNKVTVPNIKFRKLSAFSVASYIANPTSAGIQYAAFISTSSMILANSSGKLRGNEISLNFTIDNTDNKTVKHVEWQLASEGSTYNAIPALLEKKLFDSLIGNDSLGNPVPDPKLSDRAKFGIGIRPQQTLFKDRLSALRNIVDFANSVLIKNQITGNKNFSNLNSQELPPKSTTSSWVVIEEVSELSNIDTTQITTATVLSDSYYNGGWTVYQFNGVIWDRIRTQSYNTTLYWEYADWTSLDYDVYKNISYVVDNVLQLANFIITAGQYIKIKNRGDGNYIIVTLASPDVPGTFNKNFDVVYVQNGTIQLKDTLWNLSFGWDSKQAYSQTLFDQTPNIEISNVLTALKQDLFINDLSVNWNLLIFKSIKYALSEQKFIDWAFKTSLVDVINYAGTLTQLAVYKLQDSTVHENYVNEVKPYHTKVRRFTANFENFDDSNTSVTDYDYPFGYNSLTREYSSSPIPLTNFTFPGSYNPITGKMTTASYTSATILTTVPWRQTSTKLLFDRISAQTQIGNATVIDNFVGKAGDTIFQLSWLAQADKSKISVTIDNIPVFSSNYTVTYNKEKYLSYDKKYSYLKFLSPIIPLTSPSTTNLNTQTFIVSITYQKSVELMSASERIQNFYMPTADMPSNNINHLISGASDPRKVIGGQYEGIGFANVNSGIDIDTLINPSNSNYPSWNGGGLINALGISPSDIIIDGSFGFISTASNQVPEEFVPGVAADSIAIDVYTKSSYQTPTIFNGNSNIIKSNATSTISLSIMPPTIGSISVTLNGKLFTYIKYSESFTSSNQFSIDWANKTLIIPPQIISGTLGYSIIGVGDADLYGLGILDVQLSPVVVSTTTSTAKIIGMVNYSQVNGTYVTVDGLPIDTTIYAPGESPFYALSTASSRDSRAAVNVYNLSTGTHLIQSWFFNSSNPKFNKIVEQKFYINETPSFVNDLAGYATGIILTTIPSVSSQSIVELIPDVGNPVRLRSPFVSRYIVTSSNVLTDGYPILSSTSSFVVDTIRAANIQVYLNGVPLNYSLDGTQDYTISNNSVFLTSRQTVFNNLNIGSIVNIETFYYNNVSNDVSIIDGSVKYDYDFMIPPGSSTLLLTPNYSYLTSATIKITTFVVEDSLGIVSQRFVGNPKRTYSLSSPVLNSNYLWVEVNTTSTGLISLINNIDYQILDDHLTVLFSDAYVLTNKDTVFIMSFADPGKSAKTLGYRITKDFLGKSSFTRLANDDSTYLTQPLSVSDTSIFIADGSVLSPANMDTNSPGVILIAGERIEFFKNVNNVLSQLRRGTGGTSPAHYLEVGTIVIDQGVNQIINASIATPYSNVVLIQNTYTSANLENTYTISTTTIYNLINPITSSTIQCDGISLMTTVAPLPKDPYTGAVSYKGRLYSISTASIAAKDQLEVYYGGRLLKKDQSFYHDTTILYDGILPKQIKGIVPSVLALSSATIYLGDAYICQDTNEVWVCTVNQYNIITAPTYVYSGLKRLLPDFTITTSTQQIILNTATVNIQIGTQLTVIKRQVATSWNDVQSINSSAALLNSTSTIAKFLLAGPAVLPSQYFYGSSSTIVKPTGGLI